MTTLLIDMPAGIAGDMLLAALLDLGGDREAVERDLLALGVGPIAITATPVSVSGISACQVDVIADQEPRWSQPAQVGPLRITGVAQANPLAADAHAAHPHRPYANIRDCIAAAKLPERVKTRAQRVFRLLAEAEGAVHGIAPELVEFHEVGSLDAIADVVGCCLLLEQLGIDRVIAGPLIPGEGSVHCAHGRMPVPVPAVAALLATSQAPQRRLGRETGELTTPTGCALVVGLAEAWLDHEITVRSDGVGYGAGHKRFPDLANVLRVHRLRDDANQDQVCELRATIDDATGEDLAQTLTDLLAAGARDAWLVPVIMKKGRPGHELVVLSAVDDRQRMADMILSRTTSIGLRWQILNRQVLPRQQVTVMVDGHAIPCKVVTLPDGSQRAKPEADAITAAAHALKRSPRHIREEALVAWRREQR
jgi:pyridinium-3,5-bisthiocarboxylic acid mononucleotide nickel chelatase